MCVGLVRRFDFIVAGRKRIHCPSPRRFRKMHMRILMFTLLSCFATFAWASDAAMARFNQLMADEQLRQQAYADAQERVRFCSYCHGENGNSKRDYIPNLAGQSPVYLFKAFETFASGERTDFVMSKLAQTL